MKLVFDIVKSGNDVPRHRNFHFDMNGGTIGRNENCDWTLTDTQNYISGQHASIIFMDGIYFFKDESTNGTFLKHPYKRLPKGHPVKINASDIFIVGDHEVQARYSLDEYAQDDIIGTINKSQSQENVIPNDDFLFESESNSFGEVESSTEEDILDLFNDQSDEKDLVDDMFDTIALSSEDERIAQVIPPAAIGADFDDFLEQEDAIDATIEPLDEHFIIPAFEEEQESVIEVAQQDTRDIKSDIRVNTTQHTENPFAILEKKLGIDFSSVTSSERQRMLGELGDMILNTLEHLGNSVQTKEKIKQDLRLSSQHFDPQTNNPVMLGRSAIKLLQSTHNDLGMMTLSSAITKSIQEINQHNVALHGASKNLMKIVSVKFAPKYLEQYFESNGTLQGESPTPARMWKAYSEHFASLQNRPEWGSELIAEDFSKEYENIDFSLQLNSTTVTHN